MSKRKNTCTEKSASKSQKLDFNDVIPKDIKKEIFDFVIAGEDFGEEIPKVCRSWKEIYRDMEKFVLKRKIPVKKYRIFLALLLISLEQKHIESFSFFVHKSIEEEDTELFTTVRFELGNDGYNFNFGDPLDDQETWDNIAFDLDLAIGRETDIRELIEGERGIDLTLDCLLALNNLATFDYINVYLGKKEKHDLPPLLKRIITNTSGLTTIKRSWIDELENEDFFNIVRPMIEHYRRKLDLW